jgi:glycosyltransferase involved in cell wall biosynthesis
MKIALLTAGKDRHYALGLLSGLVENDIHVDFIGNDDMQDADIVRNENVNYINLRGDQRENVSITKKIYRVLKYYFKLIKYAAQTNTKVFHILWLNKFIYFDRTLLNIYFKILGKKLVFTAHNINMRERDGNDNIINRLTLRFMYKILDNIFVHGDKLKLQLVTDYNVENNKITVIPYGINNTVPHTELTRAQARTKLQIDNNKKILLFFGNIAPYKGLEYLIDSMDYLRKKHNGFNLIIAGKIKNCEDYWKHIKNIIDKHQLEDHVIQRIEFIPDEEIEYYFKSADVLVLPYKFIYQSGPLFLSYFFGLPVIASDVGSFKEDVVEGETGLICRPENPKDLANKIEQYFQSDLYKNMEINRNKIMNYANERYSWKNIGEKTAALYRHLLYEDA